MNQLEQDLLNNKYKLRSMNSLLDDHQFSEDFLIKTIGYYDSWICLRTQENLSPYFCFRYLYDNQTDSANYSTDFEMIDLYLKKRNYTNEQIEGQYKEIFHLKK